VFVASRCDRFWCETGAVIAVCLRLRESPANTFAGGSVTPLVLGRAGIEIGGLVSTTTGRRRQLPTKCAKNPREQKRFGREFSTLPLGWVSEVETGYGGIKISLIIQ
jgi:hypothetical protein